MKKQRTPKVGYFATYIYTARDTKQYISIINENDVKAIDLLLENGLEWHAIQIMTAVRNHIKDVKL